MGKYFSQLISHGIQCDSSGFVHHNHREPNLFLSDPIYLIKRVFCTMYVCMYILTMMSCNLFFRWGPCGSQRSSLYPFGCRG